MRRLPAPWHRRLSPGSSQVLSSRGEEWNAACRFVDSVLITVFDAGCHSIGATLPIVGTTLLCSKPDGLFTLPCSVSWLQFAGTEVEGSCQLHAFYGELGWGCYERHCFALGSRCRRAARQSWWHCHGICVPSSPGPLAIVELAALALVTLILVQATQLVCLCLLFFGDALLPVSGTVTSKQHCHTVDLPAREMIRCRCAPDHLLAWMMHFGACRTVFVSFVSWAVRSLV